MIEPDDFALWHDHPVTRALFEALTRKAEEAKTKWMNASWEGGTVDERLLVDLRATAESWLYIVNMDLAEMEEILGEDGDGRNTEDGG